jgi:hypothetical protein
LNGFFLDYYNQHSWEIEADQYQFSGSSQIETWSKLDFKNYLNKNYQELDQQKRNEKISLKNMRGFFINDYIAYFPTLWDWYSVKKIDFLSAMIFLPKMNLEINHN